MAKKKRDAVDADAEPTVRFPKCCPVCGDEWGQYALGHLTEHGLIEPVPLEENQTIFMDMSVLCKVCNQKIVRRGKPLDTQIWAHVREHKEALASANALHSMKVLGG